MTALPDYLPILAPKMTAGDYSPVYRERELTEPVLLCDRSGNLNPDAVGWSRAPLVTANLRGRWPRKKRWNFWNWISPDFVFSVTLADIDLASFCAVIRSAATACRISAAVSGRTDRSGTGGGHWRPGR